MALLFDHPRPVRFRALRTTSHLMSDLADPEEASKELRLFAKKISLHDSWIQNVGMATEHFDLFDGAISRARRAGAEEVSSRDLISRVVVPRRSVLSNGSSDDSR